MEPGKAVATGRLQNIRVYWLAFVVYWPITSKTNTISSNVVSVLQAGAFFGTLVLFTLIFALGAALTTPVTPVFVPERSPKEDSPVSSHLASHNRSEDTLTTLAYLRRRAPTDEAMTDSGDEGVVQRFFSS
ncbi:hypothetical protein B0H13DRAFT_2374827 [Mycena leptocephala]|nr:hypothetical protein B0H13DRAFT_2374827 [Mycena leptocephala]